MAISTHRDEQTDIVQSSLRRSLSLYALAAGAAGVYLSALASPSEAEVVYTPVHKVIGRNQLLVIDLNNDGITDFTIFNRFTHASGYELCQLKIAPDADGAVVHSDKNDGSASLPKGVRIGFGDLFEKPPQGMAARFEAGGSYNGYGGWFNASNRYLGLNFKIDGQVHYGWARLSVFWNHNFLLIATLTGYAYETEPGKAIISGDTGSNSEPEGEPMSGVPEAQSPQFLATLGALSLGAPGLAIWRRPAP